MAKSVFKEIIIMLLLGIAIVLIFGVLFYEYIPSNKMIPSKIAYTTPENVVLEIAEEVNEAGFVNITYQLDQSEIDMSKRVGDYKSGKQNPFEAFIPEDTTSTQTADSSKSSGETSGDEKASTNSNETTENNNNNSNNNSYLPNNGNK